MKTYQIINLLVATVWIAFGLFGKILPENGRHEQIVAEILPSINAHFFTKLIGIAEIVLGAFILVGFQRRKLAIFQMLLILTMNVLEQIFAPQHLLFGRLNLLLALCLCGLIYWNEFTNKQQRYA